MKQLTTYRELVAHKDKKVKFLIEGKEGEGEIRAGIDGNLYIFQYIIDGVDCGDILGYMFSYWIGSGDYSLRKCNIFLIEEEGKKKAHTYETIYGRDDGVEFTETTIGGVSIEKLREKEQELYTEARAIRADLNAHANKFKK